MSKRADPKLIGGFVLGAIALVLAGVVIFGSGRFFRDVDKAVMYFQGSVQGLNVGAPVTFRGVKIGEVAEIELRLDTQKLAFIIPVFVDFFPEATTEIGEVSKEDKTSEFLEALIDKGLRARLVPLSLVTGQLSIQLDLIPESKVVLVGADPKFDEIPTVPSTFEKMDTILVNLANALKQLDLEGTMADLRETVGAIRDLATKPEIGELFDNANATFQDLDAVLIKVDRRIDPLLDNLARVTGSADKTLQEAQETLTALQSSLGDARRALRAAQSVMATAEDVIEPNSQLYFRLLSAFQEVALSARSLRNLLDQVEQNPNLLLFGRPKGASR